MHPRLRLGVVVAVVVALFTSVQLGALALVGPFESAGFQSVEDPQDPTNSILYLGILLVATAFMLLAIKYDRGVIIRGVIILTSGLISAYVFVVTLPELAVAGYNATPLIGGLVVMFALARYPEWWVIDSAGVIMGIGAAGIFGISFGVLPAIILLGVLAVYDAISVYGTEHMLTLASGVMAMKVPVLFVVPTTLDYSFLDDTAQMGDTVDETGTGGERAVDADGTDAPPGAASAEQKRTPGDAADDTSTGAVADEFPNDALADGERPVADGNSGPLERDALFIGLGDAVMPAILTASAAFFLDTPTVLGVESAALGALLGTIVGLLVLLRMVLKGRAHAGLPLLNGGAIAGYLVGATLGGVALVDALGLAPYL